MDPSNMTMKEVLVYSALINAGIGLALGLVPLITGFVKGRIKYGVIGLIGSIAGGALLGLILAVPVAAIFTWLIARGPKSPAGTAGVAAPVEVPAEQPDDQ